MSEQRDDVPGDVAGGGLDAVLADPARLLDADRAEVREHLADTGGDRPGREVFLQAEAMFGDADVPRAEFASWLHFAAKATGHEEYAERIAAAEPGMPWRTVWAWWRPVNWFTAHPSLNGDSCTVELHHHEGRDLVVARDLRGPVWLDAGTGRRVPAPAGETTGFAGEADDDWTALWKLALSAPESWGEALPLATEDGRTRYLWDSPHGLAVFEIDAAVLRDWPRGDLDDGPSGDGTSGPEPEVRRPTGSLTAARVDDAFGAEWVLRVPEEALPEGIQHPGSRRHLRDVGVPLRWICHGAQFTTHTPEAMRPPADGALPDGLIALGSCEYGEIHLHGSDGTVHLWGNGAGPADKTLVTLAPDLDVFTRTLEAVYRYSNACWHPYATEGGQDDVAAVFLAELDELAPGLFDTKTPSGEMWSWIYAGITEIGVDGY